MHTDTKSTGRQGVTEQLSSIALAQHLCRESWQKLVEVKRFQLCQEVGNKLTVVLDHQDKDRRKDSTGASLTGGAIEVVLDATLGHRWQIGQDRRPALVRNRW